MPVTHKKALAQAAGGFFSYHRHRPLFTGLRGTVTLHREALVENQVSADSFVTLSHNDARGSSPQGHIRAGAVGRGRGPGAVGRVRFPTCGRGPAAGLKNLPVGLGIGPQQAGHLGLQGEQSGMTGGAARGHDAREGLWFFWRPSPL